MKKSFSDAYRGLCAGIKNERNLRIHLAFAFYVLLAAAVTDASRTEWCIVVLCIGVVITSELVNTAVERLCDYINPERSREIGLIKDLAAGAVLVFALASAFAGGIIFFNAEKIGRTIEFVKEYPFYALAIVATVPIAAYLVFRSYDNDK